jgi:hypothetical protein
MYFLQHKKKKLFAGGQKLVFGIAFIVLPSSIAYIKPESVISASKLLLFR